MTKRVDSCVHQRRTRRALDGIHEIQLNLWSWNKLILAILSYIMKCCDYSVILSKQLPVPRHVNPPITTYSSIDLKE
jgi:hypothetical protein